MQAKYYNCLYEIVERKQREVEAETTIKAILQEDKIFTYAVLKCSVLLISSRKVITHMLPCLTSASSDRVAL